MSDDLKSKPEDYWKQKLTPDQYHVIREKGTEPRFTGTWDNKESGMYECAACGHPLFSSEAKYELPKDDWNYGWPSFDKPANRENIELKEDNIMDMHRTEVTCKNCGAHLGHLFEDGPKETTRQHYCINSCSLNFKPKKV